LIATNSLNSHSLLLCGLKPSVHLVIGYQPEKKDANGRYH
jgi:hypothetical protein